MVFNKIPPSKRIVKGISSLASVYVPLSKSVEIDGNGKRVQVFERISSKVLAQRSDIPESDNYLLSEMLKQGFVPDLVNVNGLFDSSDSLDSKNEGLINQFNEIVAKENVTSNNNENE